MSFLSERQKYVKGKITVSLNSCQELAISKREANLCFIALVEKIDFVFEFGRHLLLNLPVKVFCFSLDAKRKKPL